MTTRAWGSVRTITNRAPLGLPLLTANDPDSIIRTGVVIGKDIPKKGKNGDPRGVSDDEG